MAVVSPHSPLDAAKIKLDFPILATKAHGSKPLVYLDSANSSQKPEAVIEAVADVYRSGYANVHRGVYELGVHVTEAFEGARDKVAAFINAPSRREVIFVRQATEALNLVAYAYGRKFIGEGDVIVTTEMEHHSNLVPWQFLAQQTGATLRYIRITDDGELDPASIEELGQLENVKLVAVTQSSNTLGTLNDIPALVPLGARARRGDRGRRRPGCAAPAGRRAGARLSTSTRSRATRCAAPAPARCGAARSCSSGWIRS